MQPDLFGSQTLPSFSFIGDMCSGKTTYSNALKSSIEREFFVKVLRPSISEEISKIAVDYFGMKGKDRRLLQEIGMKMDEIDDGVWAKKSVQKIRESGGPFIIDNIRTPAQEGVFRSEFPGLITIKLEADEAQRFRKYKELYGGYPTPQESSHVTEKGIHMLHYDIKIFNDYAAGTIEPFVSGIVASIKDGSIKALLRG